MYIMRLPTRQHSSSAGAATNRELPASPPPSTRQGPAVFGRMTPDPPTLSDTATPSAMSTVQAAPGGR